VNIYGASRLRLKWFKSIPQFFSCEKRALVFRVSYFGCTKVATYTVGDPHQTTSNLEVSCSWNELVLLNGGNMDRVKKSICPKKARNLPCMMLKLLASLGVEKLIDSWAALERYLNSMRNAFQISSSKRLWLTISSL